MLYKFNDYVFDSERLVLNQGEQSIEIRHNDAKLLALLLDNADQVLAKEHILSQVWQGKIVSEQAVFQSISNLRSLLGNEAIKTFSKRGYQWQLALTIVASSQSTETKQEQSVAVMTDRQKPALVGAFLLLFIMVFSLVYTNLAKDDPTVNLAYVPIKTDKGELAIEIAEFDLFNATELSHIDYWRFIATKELEFHTLAAQHPLLLAGKVREFEQVYYLDFVIKGIGGEWQGQLSADSIELLEQKFKQHLAHDFIYRLLRSPHSYQLQQAELSLAHQQTPTDFVILRRLVEVYVRMAEFEKAMALAEKHETMALEQSNTLQQAAALLAQGQIMHLKKLYDASDEQLLKAELAFNKINDLQGQALVWEERSQLAYVRNDYGAVRDSLLASSELAKQAKNVDQELHTLTYLSVIAHKFKQDEDKYLYLTKAEQAMEHYQLPEYRFAKIPFHHAIYTQSKAAKEPHLKRVLAFTRLTPDHWVAQVSRQQLVEFYLQQERLTEAENLVAQALSDNAHNSYLRVLLAAAKANPVELIAQAKKTFEQAELTGNKSLSLNAALVLLEQSEAAVNVEFYSQYIAENATPNWRRINESKLVSLNL